MSNIVTARNNWVAILGESPRSMSRLMTLESISKTSETELNEHLINLHIPTATVMNTLGFQYDAELAAFLGYSLQPTADLASLAVDIIGKGLLDDGTYRKIFGKYGSNTSPSDYGEFCGFLNGLGYTDRLKAELQTLSRLGVASVDLFDTYLGPISDDSFFEHYHIVDADSTDI